MSKPEANEKMKDAATPKRDDFLTKTVQRLRDSAGNVCSYPDCYVHTHGAKASGNGALSIGVACHIRAAAPGGPRYDASQTKDERRHIDNGIWMCQTHSKLIDADDSAYTIETLHEWKRIAEARSNAQLNQKSFTEREVKKAVDAGAVSMLQKWVNQDADPLETPIAEVMKGYESNLENLDPRFTIEVNKIGNNYTHVIQAAQEKVSIDLVMQNLDKLENFWAAEKAFVEEGRELVLPSSHFELKGSKLFEAIQQKTNGWKQGMLTIGGIKKSIVANLYLRTIDGREVFIESFTCYYTSGTLRTVFEGTALDGFISVNAQCSHNGQDHKFDLKYSVDAWKGKNILELPRFARLLKAAQQMDSGRLVFELEVGSKTAAFDSKSNVIADDFHAQLQWIILYLDMARKVAEHCSEPIFLNDLDFAHDLYAVLQKYLKLLAGPIYTRQSPGLVASAVLDYSEGSALDSVAANGFPSEIKLAQQDSLVFELFGCIIRAPRIERVYDRVETLFFSNVEERGRPKMEVYATPDTNVLIQLHPDDAWVVLDDWEARERPATSV